MEKNKLRLFRLCEQAPDGGNEEYVFSEDESKAVSLLERVFLEYKKRGWVSIWSWEISVLRDDIQPDLVFTDTSEEIDGTGGNVVQHWRRLWTIIKVLHKHKPLDRSEDPEDED